MKKTILLFIIIILNYTVSAQEMTLSNDNLEQTSDQYENLSNLPNNTTQKTKDTKQVKSTSNHKKMQTEKKGNPFLNINNSTGLETLDEGSGIGWRLVGRNPNNYGPIGAAAIDFSNSQKISEKYGATGPYSFATGLNTIASGNTATALGSYTTASSSSATALGFYSTASGTSSTAIGATATASGETSIAIGSNIIASGEYATALGRYSSASGNSSIAIGMSANALGDSSTAFGFQTIAQSYAETVMGRFNTEYTPNSTTTWDINDRLLVVGNGESFTDRKDALIIFKNGNVKFDGKIQQTTTGKANMIPIAYGTITADGNILSGTGNFTASIKGNVFTIIVNGENLTINETVCSITPEATTAKITSAFYKSNNLQVRIFNIDGTLDPTNFQFVIYSK